MEVEHAGWYLNVLVFIFEDKNYYLVDNHCDPGKHHRTVSKAVENLLKNIGFRNVHDDVIK